jgi:hypothetical protein
MTLFLFLKDVLASGRRGGYRGEGGSRVRSGAGKPGWEKCSETAEVEEGGARAFLLALMAKPQGLLDVAVTKGKVLRKPQGV